MTAYLGSLKGYEYIWQAIEDPEIEVLVFKAMLSVAAALSKAYDADLQKLISHVEDLVYRFGNRKLGDTAFRVGRDIPRKLSPEDRLIGAIKLCREVDDNPAYLYAAVAAALGFAKNELPDFSADRVMTDISKLDKSSEEFKRILEFKELIDKKDLTGVNLLAKKLKNG
jgi:mannitol-1-phosphate 5-dehydrogenase